MIEPKTLKGFRDFLPKEARKRQFAVRQLAEVFESYGFEPLETPAMEYEQILLGKYGEEGDQLMYRFVDRGERRVAMRYDQTVPLARVIAQYQNELAMPFKRYQIQPVWRAENPQKGRFREFMQCDADIVGLDTPLTDAEAIVLATKSLEALGFKNYKILINDRSLFESIPFEAIASIDKLKKIGRDGVVKELISKGFSEQKASSVLQLTEDKKPTKRLLEIFSLLEKFGISKNSHPEFISGSQEILKQVQNDIKRVNRVEFSPTLARGLNYYTGLIFEIEIDGYTAGSVCGGGRYNNLIGMFANRDIPAVGFAFGFDRLIDAMTELKLFPDDLSATKVLVTIFSPEYKEKAIEISSRLRSNNINTELYLDENAPLDKQLKYANQKQIPYVLIIGQEEAEKNMVTVKNMQTREQKMAPLEEITAELR